MKNSSINSKLKILIIEEDDRLLKRLQSWVIAIGHIPHTSNDGIVALELFDELTPDILLVSQELKNMGGIEFIEKIKLKNPTQAIILIMEKEVDSLIFKRSIDFQVDKYLNKPVDATLLFRVIEELAKEKLWYKEYEAQKRLLQDYKIAIDISFSVSKHDKNGEIFYVNNSFCETTNLSYDEAIKGTINPLKNPNTDLKSLWDTLNSANIYRARQTFVFEDKQDHIIDVIAVPILNEEGEVEEFLVFSNDVSNLVYSARKIKEQEINTKIQKLEHIKEVNRIKDSFLTVFTHELKTPLNAIINFSEYVSKHLAKEDFAKKERLLEQIESIHSSGWYMLDMITNLIEATKLRDSKITLNISTFSLNTLIERSLSKYDKELQNVKIIKAYPQECTLSSDEERFLQILNNLIANGIKYAKGTLAISVRSNKEEFILEIMDDGEGFSNAENVFNLFEQSSKDEMTRTATGIGVGLFIIKRLCDRMGFKIELLKSEKLGGAKVLIRGKKDIPQ